MKITKIYDNKTYLLTNENLKVTDKVFPVAKGKCVGNNGWILNKYSFEFHSTGFPSEPHTIINLNYSEYKPYQIQTNYGYGPIESYYKIIEINP